MLFGGLIFGIAITAASAALAGGRVSGGGGSICSHPGPYQSCALTLATGKSYVVKVPALDLSCSIYTTNSVASPSGTPVLICLRASSGGPPCAQGRFGSLGIVVTAYKMSIDFPARCALDTSKRGWHLTADGTSTPNYSRAP